MIGAITFPFHTSLSSCLWVALSEYAAHKVFTPLPCFPSFASFFSCVIHFRLTPFPQAAPLCHVSSHGPPPIAAPHVPHGLPNLSALHSSDAAG